MSNGKACRIAKELAEENGGKPSDYMSEAWEIVRASDDRPRKRQQSRARSVVESSSRKRHPSKRKKSHMPSTEEIIDKGLASMGVWGQVIKVAGGLSLKTVKYANKKKKSVVKKTGSNMNFTKAPKDSPGDVFGGLLKMTSKSPDKIEVPESLKKYVKDTFRFK